MEKRWYGNLWIFILVDRNRYCLLLNQHWDNILRNLGPSRQEKG